MNNNNNIHANGGGNGEGGNVTGTAPTLPILRFPKKNRNRSKHPRLSETEKDILWNLVPQDLWLYEYGQRLFEARWRAYQKGTQQIILPSRPPIPKILSCVSTRFQLNCTRGPLKGSYSWDGNTTTTMTMTTGTDDADSAAAMSSSFLSASVLAATTTVAVWFVLEALFHVIS